METTRQDLIELAKINGACGEAAAIIDRIRRRIVEINAEDPVTRELAGGAAEMAKLAQWVVNRSVERLKIAETIAP